jgi:hypothetical protein
VTEIIRESFFDAMNEFSHTYEGLFVATGPSIDTTANINLKSTENALLAPGLFGYQPPPILDGEAPLCLHIRNRESLSPAPEHKNRRYLTQKKYNSEETVTNRLDTLGYLE